MTKNMTPREALVAFYTMREDYLMLFARTEGNQERDTQERNDTWTVLEVLTEAVLGPRASHHFPFLCDVCQERYAETSGTEPGKKWSTYCCTPCMQELRTAGKLVEREEKKS